MNKNIIGPDEAYADIMYHICNKLPFSMVRLGDGEMLLLKKDELISKHGNRWENAHRKYILRQVGYDIPENIKTEIIKNIKDTIFYSDLIGIDDGIKHKYFNPDSIILENQREYIEGMFINANKDCNKFKYCSMMLHMHLLESMLLYKIISELTDIVIISPRNVVSKLKSKFTNLKNVEYYYTPGEFKFEIKDASKPNNKFKYTVYTEILKKIHERDRKGEVCLYGAGFIGKGFGYNFKKAGGIALDIGSVFDLWVGKKTRGEGKGPDAKINDYLLA